MPDKKAAARAILTPDGAELVSLQLRTCTHLDLASAHDPRHRAGCRPVLPYTDQHYDCICDARARHPYRDFRAQRSSSSATSSARGVLASDRLSLGGCRDCEQQRRSRYLGGLRSEGQARLPAEPLLATSVGNAVALPALTVITVGRLVEQKGFDVLLTAWSKASTTLPGWRLAIVGDGPLEAELKVSPRGLASRTAWTGSGT